MEHSAASLLELQTFGVDLDVDFDLVFVSAVTVVVGLAGLMRVQEEVQYRVLMNPKGKWGTLFGVMTLIAKTVAGPACVPLLRTLLWPMTHIADGELWWLNTIIGVMGAVLLATFALRLARVDFILNRIEMKWNPFDWREGIKILEKDRYQTHPPPSSLRTTTS